MDDELLIELDDDFELEGKVKASLPLTSPRIAPPMEAIPYKDEVELTVGADRLFDFSKTKLSPIQQMYIIGFATRGTKKGACQLAGVTFGVVNKWMESKEFSGALQNAVEIARDALEEELLRRAMNGSDKLLLEAVKASKPDKYNKKQSDVNINGTMVHTWADLAKQAVAEKAVIVDSEYREVESDG